jgi:hypothetical protein
MRWITRERPKIDRVACPWLIKKFIDRDAEFLFVPPDQVLARAQAFGATPFDVPGVTLSHRGELCTFDTLLDDYQLHDAPLDEIARIVRGADTDQLDLTPQSGGLLAISLGLSQLYADDHEMLAHGYVVYDALYAWATKARQERHGWNPPTAPAPAPANV